MVRALPLCVVLMACTPDGGVPTDADAVDATGLVDSGLVGCGDAPPAITSLSVDPAVIADHRVITAMMLWDDADGALHRHRLRMWWDTTLDGEVDLTAPPAGELDSETSTGESTVPTTPCEVYGGFPALAAFRWADDAPVDQPVEVALVLEDADGLTSAPAVRATCVPSDLASNTCADGA